MATITEINKQKRNKNRYNIYLDGEYAGALNIDEIVLNGLKADKEILPDVFKDIIKRDNEKYAFNLAIKYISLKLRTIFETKQHLLKKDLDIAVVDTAVAKVMDYGYLNDEDYANTFVSYQINSGKFGKSVVEHKLKIKGISKTIISKALMLFSEDQEYDNAKKIFDKVYKRNENIEPIKRRNKLYRTLASKGYSYDVINKLLRQEDNE